MSATLPAGRMLQRRYRRPCGRRKSLRRGSERMRRVTVLAALITTKPGTAGNGKPPIARGPSIGRGLSLVGRSSAPAASRQAEKPTRGERGRARKRYGRRGGLETNP